MALARMVETLLRATSPSTLTLRMLNIGWRTSHISAIATINAAPSTNSTEAVMLSRRTSSGMAAARGVRRAAWARMVGRSGFRGLGVERGQREQVQAQLFVGHAVGG